jgi:hypothetical protein
MKPLKHSKKLAKIHTKAQLCITREDAQKYIKKAEKLQAKVSLDH